MAREPANWRRLHFDMVQSQWKSLQAYLRWKTTQYLAAHPDLPPPDEVRLIVRLYPSPTGHAFPKEPASRNVCLDQPFVRWRYRDASRGDCLPLEAFDCATGQFVALPHPKHPSPTPRLAYSHE
jgi:hypothetical protein